MIMPEISDNAAAILIAALMEKLEKNDKKIQFLSELRFALYCFLGDKAREMIVPWVQFVYEKFPKDSKEMVSIIHDDIIDLTTIPCTGTDFKPWKA